MASVCYNRSEMSYVVDSCSSPQLSGVLQSQSEKAPFPTWNGAFRRWRWKAVGQANELCR